MTKLSATQPLFHAGATATNSTFGPWTEVGEGARLCVQTLCPGPVVQEEEPMADPQFEAVGGKADALGAAEAVGQQHRHMACQGSLAPLQHQGQPGIKGIGPKAPQPHLGDFG